MVAGLGVASIIPSAGFWFLLSLHRDDGLIAVAGIAFLCMCWFIVVGSLFLAAASAVSRSGCQALCAALTFSVPFFIFALVSVAMDSRADASSFLGTVILGLVLVPFNLFGGWLLWCILAPSQETA